MKILVIIPAYNEEETLPELLDRLKRYDVDVLVVNDFSSDNTSAVCRQAGVNVIDLPCNLGIGGAVQTGYQYADKHGYDIAVQLDGDGQHDPAHLPDLIGPIAAGRADLVIGSRYIAKLGFQSTATRRIGIRYFSWLIRIVAGTAITDPTSGFRACNAKVIKCFASRYPVDYPEPESIVHLIRNGFRVEETPVRMSERKGGVSSIKAFKPFYYMVKVSLAIVIDAIRRRQPV